ncbi:MAG TPA: glycosyl hydrolase, partial [Flavisolibacter sp.]|nr:glycosyl hydrolase [Flavisolibacter sp.]
VAFAFVLTNAGAQIKWPAITQQTKPWTRWWWEGSAVNGTDLTWNLEQYKAAGLGGVELTPIYGVYGYEKQFVDFLSPKWMKLFDHTLKESKRLGLGVDLANGTGWPFGGPWVTDEDASKTVFYKSYTVNGGESLKATIEYSQEAFVRTANNKPAGIDSILAPVSRNKNLQALALDQIVYPGKLPLKFLMAYSEGGQTLDLTKNVDPSGKLNWTAPQGKWNLYALFVGLHGKMVERAAPGGEGYAIDHFSAKASTNYFKKFDEAFKGYDVSYLRAFFNDSYEVDDARGQSNWTPGLFEEFKKRRGYDLKNHLPALFGKAAADMNSRVLYDYRSVIDELLLEHFTHAWHTWGKTKGGMVRNQSHGSPANTLDLYGAVDIPETEGTDILRFKFASSAANVTGKPLASSESATWLDEHFLSSWGDVKKAIDLYFLGGVNHIFYHGTEYSPKEAPWPGWLFYAAVHFQPTNPQWKDFKTLNDYITRVQSFLQSGRPDNDVLVYYPIIDRYSQTGGELLQHFDGMERNFVGTDFEHASKWLVEKGYGFDFFSDRQLQNISAVTNLDLPSDKTQSTIGTTTKLISGGNTYQTILLPANKFISDKTMQKLVDLATAGATVLVYKAMPGDVPGFGGLESRRKLFQQLTATLNFKEEGKLKKATVGKGAFFVSDDLNALLAASKARKEELEEGLQFIRRKNADGLVYFINNRSDKVFDGWVPLHGAMNTVALFDAMTGKNGLAKWKKSAEGQTEILVQLQPSESIIAQTFSSKKTGPAYAYFDEAGKAQEINGTWTVEFLTGGPVLPGRQSITKLESWTEFNGEDVKNFSGTAKYSVTFQKPTGSLPTGGWLLNLGKVHATAEVFLNGKKLATLIGPTFQTTLPAALIK